MGIKQYVDKSEFDAMKSERDALAAQVEALKKPLQLMVDLMASGDEPGESSEWYKSAVLALETTPQHLSEIKAQAVSSCADKLGDAFILPHNLRKETQKAEFYKAGWRDAFLFIKQYAASIRQEYHQTWLRDSNVKSAGKLKCVEISDLEDEE